MLRGLSRVSLRKTTAGYHRSHLARFSSNQIDFNDAAASFRSKSLLELVRGYCVFQTCRIRLLVDYSEVLIRQSYLLLGDKITDKVLKKTFFGHFCAGENTEDMQPTIRRLEGAGIGSILDYAAEADIVEDEIRPLDVHETLIKSRVYDYRDEALCDERTKVFESCIRSAHALQNDPATEGFAAIKCTALGNPHFLERMSTAIVEIRNLFMKFDVDKSGVVSREEFKLQYEKYFSGGMDVEDVFKMMDVDADDDIDYMEWSRYVTIEELHKITASCRESGPLSKATLTEEERHLLLLMRNRINKLADLADQLNVKLMIDAEHTYFQPAIDNIALHLMMQYNNRRALIFQTYQLYLTDAPRRLADDISRAKAGDYHFAAKLVRGAYMELERNRATELGVPSPILDTKEHTHMQYNAAVASMIDAIGSGEKVEVMIASHNQQSIELALERATSVGVGPAGNMYFGQLLGMADHLTYSLGNAKYRAYKYVPYGKVKEVMPYLIRRAQENSDMLGGVTTELTMLRQEIKRRLTFA
ncbi:proline dehydrogenase [Ochromonadaceae sp. CCMP2298]|nr:proline dehydrogenase [Ochromonadaceae sp. CCMP2298]|mmetsp:Transcript_10552/g.23432  ORF Transcript_10552/g.23432 Transcript_10552/m.23432 type:complete len:531 (+) Transcript_10552:110-1702(+)